jgi:hypothetical protein
MAKPINDVTLRVSGGPEAVRQIAELAARLGAQVTATVTVLARTPWIKTRRDAREGYTLSSIDRSSDRAENQLAILVRQARLKPDEAEKITDYVQEIAALTKSATRGRS